MDQYPFFKDRIEAGRKLGKELVYLKDNRPIVLAILNGGIKIGVEVSQILSCPLDIVSVHKLHPSGHPEVGFGAISLDGMIKTNHSLIQNIGMTNKQTESITQEMFDLLKKRSAVLARKKPPLALFSKTAIIVDDGLDSGYTMLTAIHAVKKRSPKKIVVAVPTGSARGLELIKQEIEDVVCLYVHPKQFEFKVAASYRTWSKVSDQEVEKTLSSLQASSA
jgi:predicted phosphoribosyltransferase